MNANCVLAFINVQYNPYIDQLCFDDYLEIYKDKNYKSDIVNKILSTPVINNTISRHTSRVHKVHSRIGHYIRVAQWDIKFNIHPEYIEYALTNPEKLVDLARVNHLKIDPKTKKEIQTPFDVIAKTIIEQSKLLKEADVIVFNNIDIGMPRTDYRNTPYELAQKLGYNYVFVPEFLEVDSALLGVERHQWSDEMVLKEYGELKEYKVDKSKYKGLTGTAILSRFPLSNIRIINLPDMYDWYGQEKHKEAPLEEARRYLSKSVFKEEILRQVRVGNRVAVLADIHLAEETFTVVATQIEKRTRPNERVKQMKHLLAKLKHIDNPLILTGNFNTSTYNHSPKSIKSIIKDKLTDPDSILEFASAPFIAPIVGTAWLFRPLVNASRKIGDPTVMSIPVLSPNREKKIFNALNRFKFDDGHTFDFRGTKFGSHNSSQKFMANSNERAIKGFVPTYQTKRNLGISNFKLCWIFAKAYNTKTTQKNGANEKMAPHFGRTLHTLNYQYKYPISLQAPILADFPLSNYASSEDL